MMPNYTYIRNAKRNGSRLAAQLITCMLHTKCIECVHGLFRLQYIIYYIYIIWCTETAVVRMYAHILGNVWHSGRECLPAEIDHFAVWHVNLVLRYLQQKNEQHFETHTHIQKVHVFPAAYPRVVWVRTCVASPAGWSHSVCYHIYQCHICRVNFSISE